MNIFDSEPCEDKTKKLKITCGEVYVLMNIIDSCKKIFMTDLIDINKLDINKLDINKLNMIIPQLMKPLKLIIDQEIIADMFYFYLSSLNEKIKKFIKKNNNTNLTIDDFCVMSRNKCEEGLYNFSIQYKVCMYVKNQVNKY